MELIVNKARPMHTSEGHPLLITHAEALARYTVFLLYIKLHSVSVVRNFERLTTRQTATMNH